MNGVDIEPITRLRRPSTVILVFLIRTTLCPPLVAMVLVTPGVEAVKPCSCLVGSRMTVIVSVIGVEGQIREDSEDQSGAKDI